MNCLGKRSSLTWNGSAVALFLPLLLITSIAVEAADLTATDWLFKIDTQGAGPVETVVRFEGQGSSFKGVTRTGAMDLLRELAPDDSLADASAPMWMSLQIDGDRVGGELSLRNGDFPVEAVIGDDAIVGKITGGRLRGSFVATPFEGELPLRDYRALVTRLDEVVGANVYNPAELESEGWKVFRSKIDRVAARANDDVDFIFAMNWAYHNDPFSHFEVKRSQVSVKLMAESFDNMRTGRDSARLTFEGETAILTVDTMIGVDTIEQIDAAYEEIARKKPKALIIDLRDNGGGAFAVRPLVSHVLDKPLAAGHFVSNGWWSQHDRLPGTAEVQARKPWDGWSVVRFWNDVQTMGLLRIQFEPQAPVYDGPVFVVTNHRSASATELATAAFRSSGRAIIVGEVTAGEMLSGSYFDLGEGFIVYLPVADYYSSTEGRIEGNGVVPHVEVEGERALDRAKELAVR